MSKIFVDFSLLNSSRKQPLLQKNIVKHSISYISDCIFINKKLSWNLFLILILCVLFSLLEPVFLNLFLGHLDFFNLTEEWKIPLALGGFSLLMGGVLEYTRQYYTIFIAGKMALNISKSILQDFFAQEIFTLSQHLANDCYTRMYAIEQVYYRWIQQLCYLFSDGLFLLMQLIMMFIFSWPLALMELLFMLVMSITHQFGLKRYFNQSQNIAAQQQVHLSFFLEIFRQLIPIKMFRKELVVWNIWLRRVMPYWQAFLKNDFFQGRVLLSLSSLRKLNSLLVGLGGFYLVAHQHLHLGLFVGFLVIKSQANSTFEAIFKRLMQWQYLKTPLIRLEDMVGPFECLKDKRMHAHIELRDVKYGSEKSVSKVFEWGKKYLIKGPSGCGKTSLLKLILGIHQPQEGQVSAFTKIGVVLQNDSLFSGTLLENMTFFSEEFDAVLLKWVCEMVDLKLDKELSTQHLSQGEQQRILIARALYSQPQWLILDEATCHLDSQAEEQLIRNLNHLPLGVIMVSHQAEVSWGFDECLELI